MALSTPHWGHRTGGQETALTSPCNDPDCHQQGARRSGPVAGGPVPPVHGDRRPINVVENASAVGVTRCFDSWACRRVATGVHNSATRKIERHVYQRTGTPGAVVEQCKMALRARLLTSLRALGHARSTLGLVHRRAVAYAPAPRCGLASGVGDGDDEGDDRPASVVPNHSENQVVDTRRIPPDYIPELPMIAVPRPVYPLHQLVFHIRSAGPKLPSLS